MLRPLIKMFLLENKLRPSFVQSFALSTFPRGGRLYQRQKLKIQMVLLQSVMKHPVGALRNWRCPPPRGKTKKGRLKKAFLF